MRRIVMMITAIVIVLLMANEGRSELFQLPGVIPPSGCRVGAVLSTDQFTTTGFSNVRTANPNDEIVAGTWVVANDYVPDTSIIPPPNCFPGIVGERFGGTGLNLMAVRLKPTISSAADADITIVKLVWDINANGLYDPLLDLILQTKPGSDLDSKDGAIFFNGPQSPLVFLSNVDGLSCLIGNLDAPPVHGIGPESGTNSGPAGGGGLTQNGCFIALLAITVIGDSPKTGSQFGLSLEALAGDIPGTTGISSYTISSGFSSSVNPQASNVRLDMIGGLPSSHTPLENISNGSGSPESSVKSLTFTGGLSGEGLLSRFRALKIRPGEREAIAMAVGLCDGGELANTITAVLPPIAGAPPTIAGGLNAIPCIPSPGTDGYATGINGATLIFRGPEARFMSTVRMYADECTFTGLKAADVRAQDDIDCFIPGVAAADVTAQIVPFHTLATIQGGGDGILFQSGEIVEQVVPKFNEQTGEAIAQFGGRQEQILYTSDGNPVANGSDPSTRIVLGPIKTGTHPLILIWTVDVDDNAAGGMVDVLLGLQSYDDTAQNSATGGVTHPCKIFGATALTVPAPHGNVGGPGSCGSNFLNTGPETYSFTVAAPQHPSTPNSLAAFDTNKSCFLDDPEFFAMIDGWVGNQIGDTLFFAGVDAWVGQTNICNTPTGASAMLQRVELQSSGLGTTTFTVTGQSIDSMSVQVFSLNGALVFNQETAGNHLSWNQVNTNGAPLANGTYLYVVKVRGIEGQMRSSEVKKLILIR